MLKKIKNFLFRFLYALPFGMQGADLEIFGKSVNDDFSVTQKAHSLKLSDALLQGEVTQEVEELRYRTYKVAQESSKYNYLGDGVAIKKKLPQNEEIFYVKNQIICEGVTHELSRINEYSVDRYVLKIKYSDITRFKLEKYCHLMKVNLKENTISLFIEKHSDIPEYRMFFNELERMLNGQKSEIEDYPKSLSFITDDTFYEYNIDGLSMNKISSDKFQYTLVYNFHKFEINDIVKSYYSESMDKKYKNKEKKDNTYTINQEERKEYCSMCGKEVNMYDADITKSTYGHVLCQDCVKKIQEVEDD